MFSLRFARPTYKKIARAPEPTREKASEKASEKIIRLVTANQHITISELAETIGVTTRSIERNIKNLQTQGRLKRIGPAKGGRWDVIKKK